MQQSDPLRRALRIATPAKTRQPPFTVLFIAPATGGAAVRRAPGRPLARRSEPPDKRARLIDAAAIEIGERGLAGATVPRITARAGVSRGLLHYHFPSTAALVLEVARAHGATWYLTVESAIQNAETPAGIAARVVTAARALVAQQPSFWSLRAALVAAAQHEPPLAEMLDTGDRNAARLIGAVDALVCGFAVRPAARALDPAAWADLHAAATALLEREGAPAHG